MEAKRRDRPTCATVVGRRPDIGGACGRIEPQKTPGRFDLSHMRNRLRAGKISGLPVDMDQGPEKSALYS
jgi:hypothetical protein